MTLRLLLAVAKGGTASIPSVLPFTAWNVTREPNNPILTVTGGEPNEMYAPGLVRMANDDIRLWCKGGARIYSWLSTDNGETASLDNGGSEVIGPGAGGTWDSNYALEPHMLRTGTDIHGYYKGRGAGVNTWGWGHATASTGSPNTFTKDAANPILTSTAVGAVLGGTCEDLAICDVVVAPNGAFIFYGYALVGGFYQLIQATGTTFNDPNSASVVSLLTATHSVASAGAECVVETPSVFRVPGTGRPLYGMLWSIGALQPGFREVRIAWTRNLLSPGSWDFSDTTPVLAPTSGWESNEAYSGHVLKESQSPWLAPDIDGGLWRYAYSGLDNAGHAQSGMAYFAPV